MHSWQFAGLIHQMRYLLHAEVQLTEVEILTMLIVYSVRCVMLYIQSLNLADLSTQ